MITRNNRFTIFFLLYILFGIYCFVFGDSGILERMQLLKDQKILNSRIDILTEENISLRKKCKSIRSGESSNNFAKEEAAKSGYIASGEKYLFFKSRVEEKRKKTDEKEAEELYSVEVLHLRILWIVVSAMIIMFYFGKRYKDREE